MKLLLEIRKMKRTGYYLAFLVGALLAGAFPVVNLAARSDTFTSQNLPTLEILLEGNWQMIAMLDLFLLVIGSCVLYHIEFADDGIRKMETLPRNMGGMFAGKTILLAGSLALGMAIEALSLLLCQIRWFSDRQENIWEFGKELVKVFGYELILFFPACVLSMVIASLFKNMWISLGIGVIAMFTATMMPVDQIGWATFPYAMPFWTLPAARAGDWVGPLLLLAVAETVLFCGAGGVILRERRKRQ